MRLLLAPLLCLALGLFQAPPAAATVSAAPPPAQDGAAEEVMREYMSAQLSALFKELGRYAAPQTAIVGEVTTALGELIDGSTKALELREQGASRAAARAWSGPWRARQASRLSDLSARAKALPAFDPARLTVVSGQDARVEAMLEMVKRMPSAIVDMTGEAERLGGDVIRAAALTAEGDKAALERLPFLISRLTLVLVAAENRTIELSLTGVEPAHPQHQLLKAQLELNRAVEELLKSQSAALSGEEPDMPAVVRRIDAHLNAADAAADAVGPAAAEAIRSLSRPEVIAALPQQQPRLVAAMSSYDESAALEKQIAAGMRSTVKLMLVEQIDWDAVGAGLGAVEPMIERRAAMHAARVDQITK